MNHWILIILLQTVTNYGHIGEASFSQAFNSLNTCEVARDKVLSFSDSNNEIHAFCTEE